MNIRHFYHESTSTFSYLIDDSSAAIIIDSVADYDMPSSEIKWDSVAKLLEIAEQENLDIRYILETHIHADHVSASQRIKEKFPNAHIGIGRRVSEVQNTFGDLFNLGTEFSRDGSQFDILLEEDKTYTAGDIEFSIIETPGHTPACICIVIEKNIFVGDTIFMPDFGSGRCDFPGGSAESLFDSIQKLYALDEDFKIFVGHDYAPGGRELRNQSSIGEQKRENIHISEKVSKPEFIKFRTERDQSLSPPRLLLPSIQINLNAGKLPTPEGNGISYLKLPISLK